MLTMFCKSSVKRKSKGLSLRQKHYPIAGIFGYIELPDETDLRRVTTGWGRLDEYRQLYHPSLLVVSGIPNAGKSKWINQLAAQVATLHNWNIAIASLEGRIRYTTNTLQAVHAELRPKQG